jgi:hypothetical protein
VTYKHGLRVPISMEIIIIMCWNIWTEPNSWLFANEDPSPGKCKQTFEKEMQLVICRSKKKNTLLRWRVG